MTIDKVSLQSNTLMVTGPYYTYSIRADAVIEADVWKDEVTELRVAFVRFVSFFLTHAYNT